MIIESYDIGFADKSLYRSFNVIELVVGSVGSFKNKESLVK